MAAPESLRKLLPRISSGALSALSTRLGFSATQSSPATELTLATASSTHERVHAREKLGNDGTASIPERFRVRGKLGQGGMGIVYRAFDSELGLDVAVKTLPSISPDALFHLKNEFRQLASIRHPNLVDLHELFVHELGACFSMELVPGEDFRQFVRPRDAAGVESCDYDRVRTAGRQLALAVLAVHSAGKLHRDIKPSNVRVSPASRVVLLDFGLADSFVAATEATRATRSFVGTLPYMAPEQARGLALTPAADWYGFGVTLFEAVAGRRPLENPMRWLMGDQTAPGPARLRDLVPNVPSDLDELIAGLLDADPLRRPGAETVIRVLSGHATALVPETLPPPTNIARGVFEGRTEELQTLRSAFNAVCKGACRVVHVHGASGVGKSELVRRFLATVETSSVTILRCRCHPHESVAFNAVDGLIDDLTQALVARDIDVQALTGADAAVLPLLFPVLGRVMLDAPLRSSPSHPGRSRAILDSAARALKRLLAEMAREQPLVLWLDDAQWGDRDSGRLLRELFMPPQAPAALLILSYRTADRDESPTLHALAEWQTTDGPVPVDLPLAPLSNEQTLGLVSRLLGSAFQSPQIDLASVVRESSGLPFFAHELARHLARLAPNVHMLGELRLSDLLVARVNELPADARAVLELVCVAGGPLESMLISHASGLTSVRGALSILERASFVRATAVLETRRVEIYHDHIRQAVLGELAQAARCAHHRALAQAMLAVSPSNLMLVVEHFEAAEDIESVRRYIVAAARDALESFAFDRAVALYRRAIQIETPDIDPLELHCRLAAALVEAGRGLEAANAFEAAAAIADTTQGQTDRAASLRQRAAEQFLQSGHWDRAREALDPVLARVGLEMPANRGEAMRRVLLARLRTSLSLRSRNPSPQSGSTPPLALERAGLLMILTMVYGFTDFMMAVVFSSQLLVDAFQTRNPRIMTMGLALEAVTWASTPGRLARYQAERVLAEFARLVPEGDAFERVGLHNARGMTFWYRGAFRKAVEELAKSPAEIRAARHDAPFQMAVNLSFRYPALAHLGELNVIAAELEPLLRAADARDNNYFIAVTAVGHQSLAWLAEDRPESAEYWRARVFASLPQGFTVAQHMCVVARVLIYLYEGRAEQASACIEGYWPELKKSYLLMIPYFGEDLMQLRARASLALAARGSGARSQQLITSSLRLARKIAQIDLPYARAHADLIRAGASRLSGAAHETEPALRRALAGFEAADLQVYAACTRLALGELGVAAELERGHELLVAAGVKNPKRFAQVMAPGCLRGPVPAEDYVRVGP